LQSNHQLLSLRIVKFRFSNMSVIRRIRKNLLGSVEPQSRPKEIRDLLRPDYFNKIMLRPRYQRHIRWSTDAMNDFIGTIMNNGLIPGVIMYQLHSEDKTEQDQDQGKDFEVVDGQHRLYTLNAFYSSAVQFLPHIKKPFIVHWSYETLDEDGNKNIQRVFYKETEEVVNWYRENYKEGAPCFLTEEEKIAFQNFTMGITMLRSRLSMDQRREMFMSLQKGIPVRNSDFLKNMTSCKLISAFEEYGYEQMMTDVFFERCSKKAMNYWIQWATRCFLLFKRSKIVRPNDPPSETFLKMDSCFQKAIKANHTELNPTSELFEEFDDVFREYICLLQGLQEGVKLNPTQMFALFYRLCSGNYDLDILKSHMVLFGKEGQRREFKSLWETKGEMEPRRRYFNECLAQLESMVEVARPIDETPVSKELRAQVLEKCVNGKCLICEDNEINEDCFEAGHIVARALGGPTELDNLIPICIECNRSMGIKNAYEYKRDVYPYKCITK
jgi:hypothetical protein